MSRLVSWWSSVTSLQWGMTFVNIKNREKTGRERWESKVPLAVCPVIVSAMASTGLNTDLCMWTAVLERQHRLAWHRSRNAGKPWLSLWLADNLSEFWDMIPYSKRGTSMRLFLGHCSKLFCSLLDLQEALNSTEEFCCLWVVWEQSRRERKRTRQGRELCKKQRQGKCKSFLLMCLYGFVCLLICFLEKM
jgi:hypothetical protein